MIALAGVITALVTGGVAVIAAEGCTGPYYQPPTTQGTS
jgi:hypothetical protein